MNFSAQGRKRLHSYIIRYAAFPIINSIGHTAFRYAFIVGCKFGNGKLMCAILQQSQPSVRPPASTQGETPAQHPVEGNDE
jgi:hypothetical protein